VEDGIGGFLCTPCLGFGAKVGRRGWHGPQPGNHPVLARPTRSLPRIFPGTFSPHQRTMGWWRDPSLFLAPTFSGLAWETLESVRGSCGPRTRVHGAARQGVGVHVCRPFLNGGAFLLDSINPVKTGDFFTLNLCTYRYQPVSHAHSQGEDFPDSCSFPASSILLQLILPYHTTSFPLPYSHAPMAPETSAHFPHSVPCRYLPFQAVTSRFMLLKAPPPEEIVGSSHHRPSQMTWGQKPGGGGGA
jgi:hypothetical protein